MPANVGIPPMPRDILIRGFGFCLPGNPVPLANDGSPPERRRLLEKLGQEFTHHAETGSTDLMIAASREALANAGTAPGDIATVITAPSLLTSFGLEIPAVGIRMELGLSGAECLNLGQGCVGILRGLQLGAQFLALRPDGGDVLVVTGCRASTITKDDSHGSFFWGDGAAAVVLTTNAGPGVRFVDYAERSAEAGWDAMRVAFGDGRPSDVCAAPDDFRITVEFANTEQQLAYIEAENRLFTSVVEDLLKRHDLSENDIDALFLPSFGRNRLSKLMAGLDTLRERVATDFRYGHMGGVDDILFLRRYLDRRPRDKESWLMAMTSAFTAQWAGVLLRDIPE